MKTVEAKPELLTDEEAMELCLSVIEAAIDRALAEAEAATDVPQWLRG
jgi:hypothetical protein